MNVNNNHEYKLNISLKVTKTQGSALSAHERVLQRSVNNKTGVVTRDVPIVVSGEDLSLAELVAVAQ